MSICIRAKIRLKEEKSDGNIHTIHNVRTVRACHFLLLEACGMAQFIRREKKDPRRQRRRK
jgi:hypothetical protein